VIGWIDVTARRARVALLVASLVAGTARAEPPPASDLRYREGKQAFAAGDFDGAAARFDEAYRLSGDPAYVFNLAQAERLAGDCAAARRSYREYLARVPDAPNRADVEDKIASLESCARPRPRLVTRPATAPAVTVAAPLGPEQDQPPEARHGYGGLWVAGGGAVSLAVGFVAWRSARDKQDQLFHLTDESGRILPGYEAEADAIRSQMRTRELIALGAGAVGIGLVAGGVIYHVVQVRKARRARSRTALQVGAALLPGGGAMVVVGR
jgi:hypothetical protein